MKYRGLGLALFAAASLMMAACGGDSKDEKSASGPDAKSAAQAQQKPVTIGIVLPSYEFPFYREVKKGIDEQMKSMSGVTIKLQAASGSFTPQKYTDAIDTVSSQGVDAMAFDPYDPKLFKPIIKRISGSGTSVVIMGVAPIPGSGAKAVVNTDTEGAMRAGMDSLMKELGGSGQVGLIEFPGNGVVSKRTEFAKKYVSEFGGSIGGVAPLTAECLPVPAANATQDLLQAHKDLKGLFVGCGEPAVASARAAAQAGRRDLVIYGFDGSANEIKSIKAGQLSGTVAQHPRQLGATTVRVLVDVARGKAVKPMYLTGFDIITKDNVNSYQVR